MKNSDLSNGYIMISGKPVQAVDLFCGIGGLTRGLSNSGIRVLAGIDRDSSCRYAYEKNNDAVYYDADIVTVKGSMIASLYHENSIKILVGCAPCQPFSQMRFKMRDANANDDKYKLLLQFGRLIKEVRPEIIAMENVPQISTTDVFADFIDVLRECGYRYSYSVVFCGDYGVPQSRRRFVLLGSVHGDIRLIDPTHDRKSVTVKSFIANQPKIVAGAENSLDPLHVSAALSDLNLKRIQHSVPGGTWRDWPEGIRCDCHKKDSGKSYGSVYGRMSWDSIGPTITTQFYNYGTGRFGHPEQNRALSLREGALLQTFPVDYDFIDPQKKFSIRDIGRHIGNAVPVKLGEAIGKSILIHLADHYVDSTN